MAGMQPASPARRTRHNRVHVAAVHCWRVVGAGGGVVVMMGQVQEADRATQARAAHCGSPPHTHLACAPPPGAVHRTRAAWRRAGRACRAAGEQDAAAVGGAGGGVDACAAPPCSVGACLSPAPHPSHTAAHLEYWMACVQSCQGPGSVPDTLACSAACTSGRFRYSSVSLSRQGSYLAPGGGGREAAQAHACGLGGSAGRAVGQRWQARPKGGFAGAPGPPCAAQRTGEEVA